MDADEILGFEGWGETSVANLMGAIDAARDRPIARLLVGLGIRHVGGTVARLVTRHHRDLEALLEVPEEELAAIEGVGPVIAASITEWAAVPENRALIARFGEGGVRLTDPEPEGVATDLLSGVTVVITGSLDSMSRDAAKLAVEQRGGKVTSSVSKKTTALVSGESPGSKLQKAQDLNVVVLDEEAFLELLETGPSVLG